MSNAAPLLSVILVAHDHGMETLRICLRGYLSQTAGCDTFEIILVDQMDTQEMRDMCAELAGMGLNLRRCTCQRPGRAAARNEGLDQARGTLIALAADDFRPSPAWVEEHLQLHRNHPQENACCLGPSVYPDEVPQNNFMRWMEQSGSLFGTSFYDPEKQNPARDFFYGGNVSLKASFLKTHGRSDEDFLYHAWDDYELGVRLFRAGLEVHYRPRALSDHIHPATPEERVIALYEAGISAHVYERKYPGKKSWHRKTRQPLWRHRLRKEAYAFLYRLTGRDCHRNHYFGAWMDEAFSQGYGQGKMSGETSGLS
jgi:GT2 family glycosyltransferase